MPDIVSFKERVCQVAISEAQHYKQTFVDYEYLIYCKEFVKQKYYIIVSKEDNYAHLLGINILCTPDDFFNKCMLGKLSKNDFNFTKSGLSERAVKGTVRRKINSLIQLQKLFSSQLLVEENFIKNNVMCSIAATDLKITIGFSSGIKSYPKTLLKGNELSEKASEPTLILRRSMGQEIFNEIIYDNQESNSLFLTEIKHLISDV